MTESQHLIMKLHRTYVSIPRTHLCVSESIMYKKQKPNLRRSETDIGFCLWETTPDIGLIPAKMASDSRAENFSTDSNTKIEGVVSQKYNPSQLPRPVALITALFGLNFCFRNISKMSIFVLKIDISEFFRTCTMVF